MGKRKVDSDGNVKIVGKSRNNAGSVYQRNDGLWTARVTLPDGRRKDFYGKTAAEVLNKMQAAQGDVQRGALIPTGRETVEQFLARWLKDVVHGNVRPSTEDYYSEVVRLHIVPAIGTKRLSELTPKLVQAFLNGLTTSDLLGGRGRRKAKPKRPLSAKSVAHIRGILRVALQQAVREGLLAQNVAKLVRVPRQEQKPVAAISAEDARAILAAFRDHDYEAVVTLALATGMRRGELLGLRWSDLDLDAGTLRIERQLQRLDGEYQFVPLKTRRSRRTLALPPIAIEALRRQKVRQFEAKLAAGPAWQESGLVFTAMTGGPIHGSTLTHRYQQQLTAHGLPVRRFHDLRHGAASLLLAEGADMRRIMEQLGHSQISLTANTYTHLIPAMLKDNADLLQRALGG